jgi:hypothetical protein
MSFPHKITISIGHIVTSIMLVSSLSIGYATLQIDRTEIKSSQAALATEIGKLREELVTTRIALTGLRQQVLDHLENDTHARANISSPLAGN